METGREEIMNKDEVAALIEQIPQGLTPDDFLVELANLAASTEREACAQICDSYAENSSSPMNFAENCAQSIRQRGKNGRLN